jgi:hypothetical protein
MNAARRTSTRTRCMWRCGYKRGHTALWMLVCVSAAGCAPWVESRGVTASVAVEFDTLAQGFSPRVGVGYGYQIYKGLSEEAPWLGVIGGGGGVEVAYAPLTEALEVAAEARVIAPFLLVASVGFVPRVGMRWDRNRDGGGFFELGYTLSPWMAVELPADFCDGKGGDPERPDSTKRCPPGATTGSDVIRGDGLVLIDVVIFRPWDANTRGDDFSSVRSVALRGVLSDWAWTR